MVKTTNRRKGADTMTTKGETTSHHDKTVGNYDEESHPIEQSQLALLFFS